MDVLQKYIDEGKLVVKSGQTEFEQVATANWDSAKAQDRMDTIIAGNYSDGSNLDAVLCSNDSTALRLLPGSQAGKPVCLHRWMHTEGLPHILLPPALSSCSRHPGSISGDPWSAW